MKKQIQWLKTITLLTLLVVLFETNVFALELGDQAPEIKISEWVQGEQVTSQIIEENEFTILEFWSSWCSACQEAVPHMTKIHHDFINYGVTVIGISDQDSETVHDFVAEMGDTMAYPVAVDDQEQTTQAYLKAFNVDTIPHAFVINNQGQVIWHGNPLDNLEEVMAEIVNGTYDLQEAARQAQAEKNRETIIELIDAYVVLANSPGEQDLARELGERMIAYGKTDIELLSLIMLVLIEQAEDYQTAAKAMEHIVALPGGQKSFYWGAYASILHHAGHPEKAVESMQKALFLCDDDSERVALLEELESFRESL
ncbi:MAG: redoxin domain-containing protein [Desulfuromonadales bacterium]|nr:redoxin domain-containing protein [Desulfuromonadales bacterium]